MVVTIIDILWEKQNTGDSECRNCSLEMLVRAAHKEMGEGVLGIKESSKRCVTELL